MLKPSIFWQRLIRISELVGIIVTLILLPIDRLPYLHYIPFGLGLISLVLLLVATFGRLLEVIRAKRFSDLKKYLFIGALLALPVAAYAQSIFYAIDRSYAEHATKLLLAVALRAFCFFILVSETPALLKTIKKTVYIVTAVVVAYGFFQYIFDTFGASPKITDLRSCCTSNSTYVFPRVYSTALEPLYLDHYLFIPIWLLAFDFLRSKSVRKNKYLTILALATTSLFILTIARSAILALILSAIFFFWSLRRTAGLRDFWRHVLKIWFGAIGIALILVLISGIASLFIHKSSIYGSHSGVGSVGLFSGHAVDITDGSAQTRYSLWPKALTFIKERPLQGVGADNSRIRLNLASYRSGIPPNALQPFNNDLIGLVVDLGLIGIVAFSPLVIVLGVAVYRMFKAKWKPAAAPLALVLVGMLLQGNFFQSLLLARLWIVVGLVLTFYTQPTKRKPSPTPGK